MIQKLIENIKKTNAPIVVGLDSLEFRGFRHLKGRLITAKKKGLS